MKTRLVVLSLGLVTLLSACGGGDGDSAGGGPLTGEPGNPDNVAETIEVAALDELEFDPSEIEVSVGDTIEFSVTNEGQAEHEFVLGEASDHAHSEGMAHVDPNATGVIAPGETKSLFWTFTEASEVTFACHIDGHDSQGMTGTITVSE